MHEVSDDAVFPNRKQISVRAFFVGKRLNIKALGKKTQRLTSTSFVMKAGTAGYAVLFRYGVIVLLGLDQRDEEAFLDRMQEFIIEPFDAPELEEGTVVTDDSKAEGCEEDYIQLKGWDMERLQLVADIFAKSAVLSYYEDQMAETFERIEPVAADLQTGGVSGRRARDLLRHIGMTLSIQRKMVGQVEIDDKPEILWDNPELGRLFIRLEDEYELSERHMALKRKLDLVYKTAETMLGLLSDKRTLHVEWYIVILILIEIVITLAEKLFHW